jgi:hypothetical protein
VTHFALENGKYNEVYLHHPHATSSGGSGGHGTLVSWMLIVITLDGAILH